MKRLAAVLVLTCCMSAPALALSYPVNGPYGETSDTSPGPIDCTGKRVIDFADEQRFDSRGGVPNYRVIQLLHDSDTHFRVTEEFDTGQIHAQYQYRLRLIDPDRIEMVPERGATLTLTRCE